MGPWPRDAHASVEQTSEPGESQFPAVGKDVLLQTGRDRKEPGARSWDWRDLGPGVSLSLHLYTHTGGQIQKQVWVCMAVHTCPLGLSVGRSTANLQGVGF